ncbi:interleukin 17a/f2 [Gadus macrocephalus]|uniref:interleukin 17a/f2 n=1 Tax=Gadus macrocephalus TaxID=80720 RepID=UPI0028CB6D47|nr:interleukin 17a/f2 [Gadus macrocephalus]
MTVRRTSFQCLVVCCVLTWVMAEEQPGEIPERCLMVRSFSSTLTAVTHDNGDIHTRSLSPWTWRPTTEEHRIPHTIWEAECSHSDCSEPSQPAGARNNAVPIYQNLLVLHKGPEKNCYIASHRMVAVGCTCIRPDIL